MSSAYPACPHLQTKVAFPTPGLLSGNSSAGDPSPCSVSTVQRWTVTKLNTFVTAIPHYSMAVLFLILILPLSRMVTPLCRTIGTKDTLFPKGQFVYSTSGMWSAIFPPSLVRLVLNCRSLNRDRAIYVSYTLLTAHYYRPAILHRERTQTISIPIASSTKMDSLLLH